MPIRGQEGKRAYTQVACELPLLITLILLFYSVKKIVDFTGISPFEVVTQKLHETKYIKKGFNTELKTMQPGFKH